MIKKDRIFPNIASKKSVDINFCKNRGDWQNTDALLAKDPTHLTQEIKKIWAAWQGWGWFSYQAKVELYAQRKKAWAKRS